MPIPAALKARRTVVSPSVGPILASAGAASTFTRMEITMSDAPDDRPRTSPLPVLDVPLERDVFLRTLLRELSGALQDVVGLDEASGFVSVVGQRMGEGIDRDYRAALGVENLDRRQVTEVLVDLKRRIQGDFYVVEEDEDRIVFGNRACPFGDKVEGRPALCMMTSNVFGAIAARNLGWAKVELQETIAQGAPGCRVVVHLRPTAEAERATGREYFRDEG
jgi:hypothetical protein